MLCPIKLRQESESEQKTVHTKIIATTGRLIQLTEALKTHIIHTYTTKDIMNNTIMAIRGK